MRYTRHAGVKYKKGDKALIIGAGAHRAPPSSLLRNKGADVIISGFEKRRLALAKNSAPL